LQLKGWWQMSRDIIPEFAILGHPNEGKSSVVSTLAEDDNVRVTPVPGETIECQTFPVVIDGREIIRLTDTPGFQNPKKTLSWMKNYRGPDHSMVEAFCANHKDDPAFSGDCELFAPVVRGAGIIYVADASRPLRNVDRAEMEILRLTGRPRMAIINSKDEENAYSEHWKGQFRKHFNSIRVFNAHKATYAERISLLESLKGIDQDWEPALETVISAFVKDWERRNIQTVEIICSMLTKCLEYSLSRSFSQTGDEGAIKEKLRGEYARAVEKLEKQAHKKIKRLFKQNIFHYDLPAHTILREDLFSKKTWQVLGLTPQQLITTAGLAGAAAGAAIDVAAAGLTFGVFMFIGGAAGAGWAAFGGGKRLARTRVGGLKLGGQKTRIGPNENVQFLYVLIDRALIFYSQVINWAHGRRDYPDTSGGETQELKNQGLTSQWTIDEKKVGASFFKAVHKGDDNRKEISGKDLNGVLKKALYKISRSEQR